MSDTSWQQTIVMLVVQCMNVLIKILNQFQDQLVGATLEHASKLLSHIAMVCCALLIMLGKNLHVLFALDRNLVYKCEIEVNSLACFFPCIHEILC